MADVHHLPSVEDAENAASDWIARLNADDVSDEDRRRFEIWRSAHLRHAHAYEELMATWSELQRSGPLVRAVSYGGALESACTPPSYRRRRLSLALAATLAMAALSLGWYWVELRTASVFQTAVGERASVALPDGSTLELNSNSTARIDYRPDARIIQVPSGWSLAIRGSGRWGLLSTWIYGPRAYR